MEVLLASTTTSVGGSTTGTLLIFALLLAALWFIFEMFKREIGGLGGGSEKNIVGVLVLSAAVVVGILMGTGEKSGSHGHPKPNSHPRVITNVRESEKR
jgi:hypothetical protein